MSSDPAGAAPSKSHSAALSLDVVRQYRSAQTLQSTRSTPLEVLQARVASNESAESLRRTYERVFHEQDTLRRGEPDWWKAQFLESGAAIKRSLAADAADAPQRSDAEDGAAVAEFSLCLDEQPVQTFSTQTSAVLVGRRPGCDVHFDANNFSRLHALVYPLPETRQLLLVDVGSFHGIVTRRRQRADEGLPQSVANARAALLFGIDERVVLSLGSRTLALNPKRCLVCLEAARSRLFEACRHFVVCAACYAALRACPLCRAPLAAAAGAEGAQAGAVATLK